MKRFESLLLLIALLILSSCRKGEDSTTSETTIKYKQAERLSLDTSMQKIVYRADDPSDTTDSILISKTILKEVESVAITQSKALANSTDKVHRVFTYASEKKLSGNYVPVAVDLEIYNFEKGLDLDDVEIIDANTRTNYGYSTEMYILTDEGYISQNNYDWYLSINHFRTLLIFYIPQSCSAVDLFYWGNALEKNIPITRDTLPYPPSRVKSNVAFQKYPKGYKCIISRNILSDKKFLIGKHEKNKLLINLQDKELYFTQIESQKFSRFDTYRNISSYILYENDSASKKKTQYFGTYKGALNKLHSKNKILAPERLYNTFVLQERTFFSTKTTLFELKEKKLVPVTTLPRAVGIKGKYGQKFCHGVINLPNGKRGLLWDSQIFMLKKSGFQKVSHIQINEPYNLYSVPHESIGFYFLEDNRLYYTDLKDSKVHCMTNVDNIMEINPGPDGTILYTLGNNKDAYIGGVYNPKTKVNSPIPIQDISQKKMTVEFNSILYSPGSKKLNIFTRTGVYTIPLQDVIKRM